MLRTPSLVIFSTYEITHSSPSVLISILFAVSGEPHIISDQIQYTPTTDLAVFSVAGARTLVLQTGKGIGTSQLLWFNRSGRQLGLASPPGLFGNVALAPDGRRMLFDQMETDRRHFDIWIRDLA